MRFGFTSHHILCLQTEQECMQVLSFRQGSNGETLYSAEALLVYVSA